MELSDAKARVNLMSPATLEALANADREVTRHMTVNQAMITGALMAATGYTRTVLKRARLTPEEQEDLHTHAAMEGRLWLISTMAKLPEELVEAWYMVEVEKKAGEEVEAAKEQDAGHDSAPVNTTMLDKATINMANIKAPDMSKITVESTK